MKHLTQLLTVLVGIGLIGFTASAQLTVEGGGLIVPEGGVALADDYELDWIGTGTRIGGRPHVMNFQVGNALPLQIYNDSRVIVGAGDGTAATATNPIRLQVHGRSMVGALGVGIADGDPIDGLIHSAGIIRSDAHLVLADDYELIWSGTGSSIGARSWKMNFQVGNELPMQIFQDGRVIVGGVTGAATDANPIRLQVHGRSMVGALGVGIEDGEAIGALLHCVGNIRSDAGLQLANDHEVNWLGTGSRIGARADRMTVEVGGNLNAILEKGGRLLVGSNNHSATNPNEILLQVHGRGMLGALGVGVEDGEPLDAKLHVEGQVKITGGEPGEGKVLTSDGDGLASWQATSGGAQGPAGPAGPAGAQGAQGKQGPPGQSASSDCVECAELQQITFDAVCKIFDGVITNTAEISECIGVIGQLALVGTDVCAPNESDCLSVIQGNVQDLLDSK